MESADDAGIPERRDERRRLIERAETTLREVGRVIDATRKAMRIDSADSARLQQELRARLGPDAEMILAKAVLDSFNMPGRDPSPQALRKTAVDDDSARKRPGRYRPLV
jgi:hypothetical protein